MSILERMDREMEIISEIPGIRLTAVDSSNIMGVGKKDNNLYVMFKSGGLYQYEDVPEALYESLLKSSSKGRFVQTEIIPKFRCNRINYTLLTEDRK